MCLVYESFYSYWEETWYGEWRELKLIGVIGIKIRGEVVKEEIGEVEELDYKWYFVKS